MTSPDFPVGMDPDTVPVTCARCLMIPESHTAGSWAGHYMMPWCTRGRYTYRFYTIPCLNARVTFFNTGSNFGKCLDSGEIVPDDLPGFVRATIYTYSAGCVWQHTFPDTYPITRILDTMITAYHKAEIMHGMVIV